MKNEINSHFGFKKDFFTEVPLSGENLERFVNQTEPLKKLALSLQMKRNCGIIGGFGSGKSSFLRKLEQILISKGIFAKYFQVNLPIDDYNRTRLVFLRSTLRNILVLILQNKSLRDSFTDEELISEINRLEFSITIENQEKNIKKLTGEIAGGIKHNLLSMLIPVELKASLKGETGKEQSETGKISIPIHNENTLLDSIFLLADKFTEPVIMLIDEFDKIGRKDLSSPQWDKQLLQVLELTREIMNTEKLLFTFSLQEELYGKLQDARQGKGDSSLLGLINDYEKLNDFNADYALQVVEKAIECSGYPNDISTLFAPDIIEAIHRDCNGKVRLFVHEMIELIQQAYLDGKKQIDKDVFIKCLRKKWDNLSTEKFGEHVKS